jgi:hypothetical protein
MYPVTEFLAGYVLPAGAGLAGDPGLKAVPGGIEDHFREIKTAPGDSERGRIGARHGVPVVPG